MSSADSTAAEKSVESIAIGCARGAEQAWFVRCALNGGARNFSQDLRGKAARYASSYAASFRNLLDRLRKAGIVVERTPGPRGGEYRAEYRIVAE